MISVDLFQGEKHVGTHDFEVAPRLGEQIVAQDNYFEVINVWHLFDVAGVWQYIIQVQPSGRTQQFSK